MSEQRSDSKRDDLIARTHHTGFCQQDPTLRAGHLEQQTSEAAADQAAADSRTRFYVRTSAANSTLDTSGNFSLSWATRRYFDQLSDAQETARTIERQTGRLCIVDTATDYIGQCEECAGLLFASGRRYSYAATAVRAYGPAPDETHLYCAPCWHAAPIRRHD